MGKKKRKSRSSVSSDSVLISEDGDSSGSLSSINSSLIKVNTIPEKFIVSSVESSGCEAYARCLKSTFENLVFLHPEVMQAYSIEELVFIEAEQNRTLAIAHPLESIKKAFVVFPKSFNSFKCQELVTLQPYTGKVRTAEEVLISQCFQKSGACQNIKDMIFRLLCNKFICVGMPIKYKLFDREYEYVIKNVTYTHDISCLNLSDSSSDVHLFYKVNYKTTLKLDSDDSACIEKTTYNHLGGLKKQITYINRHMQLLTGTGLSANSPFCGTLMIQGPSGTGKSLLLKAICDECNIFVQHILWYKLCSLSPSEIKNELTKLFQEAIERAPSIIAIDDYNYLCPSKNEAESLHTYISKLLSHFVPTLHDSRVMIIATSNGSEIEESVLQSPGRLTDIIQTKIPSQSERFDILTKCLKNKTHNLTFKDMQVCAELAHGFTGKDMFDAISDAEMLCFRRSCTNISDTGKLFEVLRNNECDISAIEFSDLKMTIRMKKPSIVASNDIKVKKVQWSDIGGMCEVKEKLKQLVEWPLKFPEAFKHFNITPSRGVLMYGPPGCSKTMIAKALANECELNFISKNASDLFDKYVGESEKSVRELFVLAKAKAPCIIFLDEIDALVIERGCSSGASGVGDRIVTTLLTEIDGIEELHGVIIIAATNRPDMLDDALVRNGRINHFIYVPLPDVETREEILKICMRNRLVSENFNFKLLAEKTEGYSGAEIVNICNEAALQLLSENPKADILTFNMHHFEYALEQVLPRTSNEMINFYENFNKKHCINT